MARTAVKAGSRLIAFAVPAIPESVPAARLRVRTALGFHGLDEYADAEIVTSELVTNAMQHACGNGNETIRITLERTWNPATLTIVVSDSSPQGPIRRDPPAGSLQGRGLQIVEALAVRWGWHQHDGGKAVFAVLAAEA
jgi:anti-sigma regulatory factor (Ser/Thr protein kinase)